MKTATTTPTTTPTKPDDVEQLLALVAILAKQLPKRQLPVVIAAWKAAIEALTNR